MASHPFLSGVGNGHCEVPCALLGAWAVQASVVCVNLVPGDAG